MRNGQEGRGHRWIGYTAKGLGAVVLTAMIMALQTPPDTAISNAGLWFQKIGGVAPSWLRPESADTWATVAFSVALGAVLLNLWQSYKRWRGDWGTPEILDPSRSKSKTKTKGRGGEGGESPFGGRGGQGGDGPAAGGGGGAGRSFMLSSSARITEGGGGGGGAGPVGGRGGDGGGLSGGKVRRVGRTVAYRSDGHPR